MKDVINQLLYWPKTIDALYDPWWVIAWRFPWWVVFNILRYAMCVVVLIGFGKASAEDIWDSTR